MISVAAAMLGCTLHLTQPAQRIVSLAPDLTEIAFAAGAGDRVVGVVRGSDYPAAAKRLPVVGSYSGIDIEKILSLHPDLILAWKGVFSRDVTALRRLGIPVYVSQPQQLSDVPRALMDVGCLAGTAPEARQAAQRFSMQLEQLRARFATQKPVRMFYQIGAYSLVTVNHASWINQVIELCGGRNVFASMHALTGEVSMESVVMANPAVIISDANDVTWQTRWQRWPQLAAVQRGRLYRIDPDTIDRAGPRLLQGVAQVCGWLEVGRG